LGTGKELQLRASHPLALANGVSHGDNRHMDKNRWELLSSGQGLRTFEPNVAERPA